MIKGKKFTVIALSLMLTTGFASGAMANSGKGAGLASAPGQSESFSKGVTTVVEVDEKVTYDTKEETESVTSVSSVPKLETSKGEPVVTVKISKEKHPSQNWYREITETTTSITTTVSKWDETTVVTTYNLYETLITITDTTTTTSTHRGAPGSNGLQLSEVSVTDTNRVEGDRKLVKSYDESDVTKGEVTVTTSAETNTTTTKTDWIK